MSEEKIEEYMLDGADVISVEKDKSLFGPTTFTVGETYTAPGLNTSVLVQLLQKQIKAKVLRVDSGKGWESGTIDFRFVFTPDKPEEIQEAELLTLPPADTEND